MTSTDHRTVDGVPVKLGDSVWYWPGWGNPKLRKLNKYDLGMSWESWYRTRIYLTEQLALDGAITSQRKALKKATGEVRSARKSIDRLTARRAACEPRSTT